MEDMDYTISNQHGKPCHNLMGRYTAFNKA